MGLAGIAVPLAVVTRVDEHQLAIFLGAIGLVVLVSGLVSGLVERGPFSQVLVFVALGVLIGPWGLGILDLSIASDPIHVVATISLALVLFTDGIKIDTGQLRANWLLPTLALGPGTLLTVLAIGVAAHFIAGLSWILAFLVAAVLSSTDAVLLRDVLNDRRLPRPVRHALSVEAGMNDVLVLPLTLILATVASGAARGAGGWIRFGFDLYVLGPIVGVVVAYLSIRAVAWLRTRQLVRRDYESLYSLGVAFVAYAAAELVGGSGFIAAFAAGVTISLVDVELCDCFLEYGETTAEMAMLLTFVLLGATLVASAWQALGPATLLLAAVSLLVARPLIFAIMLRRTSLDRAGRALIAWFGPRGLSSLLLIILAIAIGIPEAGRVFGVVSVVVVASMLVHGVSATPIMDWYGRYAAPPGTVAPVAAPGNVEVRRIAPQVLLTWIAEGVPLTVIDVRRPSAYARGGEQIPGARRLTLDELPEHLWEIPRDRPVVLYCA